MDNKKKDLGNSSEVFICSGCGDECNIKEKQKNNTMVDKLLKLVWQIEKEAPNKNIKRLAKSLFLELSKYRFSTPDNSQ